MNDERLREPIVLAVAPFVRGVGFAVFSGPWIPVDWGIKWAKKKDKNRQGREAVAALLEQYRPDVLVLEDHTGEGSRRRKRIVRLLEAIGRLADAVNVRVCRYSRGAIRAAFAEYGAATKYEIARTIASEFPEFAPRLPAERKIWLPEDPRMSIFDAASLALAHFADEGIRAKPSRAASWFGRIWRGLAVM